MESGTVLAIGIITIGVVAVVSIIVGAILTCKGLEE